MPLCAISTNLANLKVGSRATDAIYSLQAYRLTRAVAKSGVPVVYYLQGGPSLVPAADVLAGLCFVLGWWARVVCFWLGAALGKLVEILN